jgi:hypothetical protein
MLVLCSLCWFRYRPRQQLDDHQRRRGLRVGQILPRGAYPRSPLSLTLTDGVSPLLSRLHSKSQPITPHLSRNHASAPPQIQPRTGRPSRSRRCPACHRIQRYRAGQGRGPYRGRGLRVDPIRSVQVNNHGELSEKEGSRNEVGAGVAFVTGKRRWNGIDENQDSIRPVVLRWSSNLARLTE